MARSGEQSGEALPDTVRVVDGLGRAHGSTVVFLYGEHDYAVRGAVESALDPLSGHVVVDLSWCAFLDSSIIAMILAKHAALARDGSELEIVLPPRHDHLAATFDQLGVRSLLHVRDAPPA
jgi:anti-anti-sigma regulatory factor